MRKFIILCLLVAIGAIAAINRADAHDPFAVAHVVKSSVIAPNLKAE